MYDENETITGEFVDLPKTQESVEPVPEDFAPAPELVIREYQPDAPQLAHPLKARTAHFGFRRGRI